MWSLSTVFRLSGRKPRSQQKLAKNISLILTYSFAQNPQSFYEPQLSQDYKKFIPATQPKTFFWLVLEKKISSALYLDFQDLHSWSTWKANVLYIPINQRSKIFVPET